MPKGSSPSKVLGARYSLFAKMEMDRHAEKTKWRRRFVSLLRGKEAAQEFHEQSLHDWRHSQRAMGREEYKQSLFMRKFER